MNLNAFSLKKIQFNKVINDICCCRLCRRKKIKKVEKKEKIKEKIE